MMEPPQQEMTLLSLYGSSGEAGALKRYAMNEFQQVRSDFMGGRACPGGKDRRLEGVCNGYQPQTVPHDIEVLHTF